MCGKKIKKKCGKKNDMHSLGIWCSVGATLFPGLGLIAATLVPIVMSTFGTVVAGVGTIHAPLAAGGCAAVLQSSSTALVTTKAAASVAALGLAAGLGTKKKGRNKGATGRSDGKTPNSSDSDQ